MEKCIAQHSQQRNLSFYRQIYQPRTCPLSLKLFIVFITVPNYGCIASLYSGLILLSLKLCNNMIKTDTSITGDNANNRLSCEVVCEQNDSKYHKFGEDSE